jgi:glucose/arabinose dehydrogenase
MRLSRLLIVLYFIALAGCDKKTPPAPPVVQPPPTNETINGTERIGWEQPAADTVELTTIGYVVYVDGSRTALPGVACASTPTNASPTTFACSGRLPTLTAGAHTLEIASFVDDGGVLESGRSATLRVTVVPVVALTPQSPASAATFTAGTAVTTDRVRLRIEVVAEGLENPADLAFAPDGHLFVAERSGRIRIFPRTADRVASAGGAGASLPEPATSLADVIGGDGQLLALALDPQFDRTRFVFAIYTAPSRAGEVVFTLARFREAAGTLADRIVLLDNVRAGSSAPRAALRFGPDAKLYAAFDEAGGDPSMRGKIVRLNADGTTPDDQAGATPIYASGSGSPGGFDWDLRSGALWAAGRDANGSSHLRTVTLDPGVPAGKKRGLVRGAYTLPASTTPSSVAVYRGRLFSAFAGNVLVASEDGRHLLRVRLDPETFTEPVATERLLQDRVGGVRAVAIAPDGAVYFATAGAIGRLVPDVP